VDDPDAARSSAAFRHGLSQRIAASLTLGRLDSGFAW
jgi:hypothetical protein